MALFKKKIFSEGVPSLNTTSTADISFMLLILFLVTTSMDSNLGLLRLLPKPTQDNMERVQKDVEKRNIYVIDITNDNKVMHDGKDIDMTTLDRQLKEFVMNPKKKSTLCESPEKHIIMINSDDAANYETYFMVENCLINMYKDLRDDVAKRRFGHDYYELTERQQNSIKELIPQRVSEK